MGRKLIVGTAMAATAVALSACGGIKDPNVCVYGPPPDEPETISIPASGEYDPSGILEPETIGEFDPSTEINEDVYGPPEYFE
ncbi:MAG: hypothetical protein MJ086_06495 [Lachnospiraceae bacterium]|nr:hypothetical protein [Lachnospiraceae bacterium]